MAERGRLSKNAAIRICGILALVAAATSAIWSLSSSSHFPSPLSYATGRCMFVCLSVCVCLLFIMTTK